RAFMDEWTAGEALDSEAALAEALAEDDAAGDGAALPPDVGVAAAAREGPAAYQSGSPAVPAGRPATEAPAGAVPEDTAAGGPGALRASFHPLTEREAQVVRLLAAGASNKEIARELGLSVRTAERHIVNIYAKIGARGRADAI